MKKKYKIPVGFCPKCNSPVIYSNHGADKKYITVICVDEDYDGRTYMCHKCKSMLAVIDRNSCVAIINYWGETAMKHLIRILLITLVLSFVFGPIHEESYKDNPDYTYNEVTRTEPKVYVTKSGSSYHNASCGYLYQSSIEKGRGQAYEEGYSACSICGGKPSGTITVTYKVKEPVPYGFKHIMGSVLLAALTACFAYGIIYTIYEVYFTDGFGGKKERTKNTITTTKPISVPPDPKTLPIPPSTPTTTLTAREMLMKIMENLDDEVINSFAGKTVQHLKYGEGIIVYIENRKYIQVYFFDQQVSKKFVYPDAFADKHLTPVGFRLAINKNALDSY